MFQGPRLSIWCAPVLAVGMLLASSARAQNTAAYLPRWGTEIRLGPYRPTVSADPRVQGVYKAVYDVADKSMFRRHPMLLGFEVDWYPLQTFGLFGLYGRASYWRVEAAARQCRNGDKIIECTYDTLGTSVTGTDTTSLSVAPVGLGIVYRYDLLRRAYDLPLLLNAKAGLDYHIWWASVGESTSMIRGKPAKGGVLGWSASVGASLGLSAFTGRTPRYGMESSAQNNYLFVECGFVHGKSLMGRKPRLDLSTNLLVIAGIAIDFS